MTPWKIIKIVAFAGALAWMAVNVAGTFMAIATGGSAGHLAAHISAAVGFGLVAWFLRPQRTRKQALPEGDRRVEMLEAEVSDLQRQLNETQRSLQFTEQLLSQRPESRKEPQ